MYTALSRVKTLDGLYILNGFDKKHLKCDIRSLNEMTRLRRQKQFRLETPCAVSLPDKVLMKFTLLNISSLHFHFKCLQKDPWISQLHIIAHTETWLTNQDPSYKYTISSDYHMHRKDRSSASPLHRGGVAVQIHTMFHVLVQFEIHTIFENTAIIVQYRANPQMKLLLITLYNKPSNKFADFITDLDRLLCKLTTDALITILSGDFIM